MRTIKPMDEFISDIKDQYNYKISEKERTAILLLDEQYGVLCDRYFDVVNSDNNVLNIAEEYDKFLADTSYEPVFNTKDRSADIKDLIECLTKLKINASKIDVFISKFYIENIKFMLRELKDTYSKYDDITIDIYEWALSMVSKAKDIDSKICLSSFRDRNYDHTTNLIRKGFYHNQLLDEAYYMLNNNYYNESALLAVVSYNSDKLNFRALYEWIHSKVPYWDNYAVFRLVALAKSKRSINELASPFVNMVKLLKVAQRDRQLIKEWRVGIEHINDIKDIKTFYYVNNL